MRPVETIYTKGLWYIMFTIGAGIVYDLSCIVVSHRVGLFMGYRVDEKSHISVSDTLGHVYGQIPKVITALATVAASAVSVVIQITVTSRALQICMGDINPAVLMVISASIVILYSAFGGIRSVTVTDILQCATFTIMVPYIAYRVFHHTGMTVPQMFKAVSQSENFSLRLSYKIEPRYYR